MKNILVMSAVAVALAAAFAPGDARAQAAGSLQVSIGANNIDPKVSSGDLSASSLPGTKIDVKDASSVIAIFTYMVTDNISVETFIGAPYKHDIIGAGAIAGVGKIGSVRQLSPTVIGQYRFGESSSAFRPYVGLGLTYTYFFHEEGSGTLTALTNPGGPPTELRAKNAWGISPQIGATYSFDAHWFVNASVIKTFIKTTSHLSTGQSIDTKLDPLAVNVSIGYRF